MIIARRIASLLLAAAAIAVWFALAPDETDAPDNSSRLASIEAEDQSNNEIADGAPQQTVVNGWTEHNYLALISDQLDENAAPAAQDERPAALLGLGVLGLSLIAFTTPSTGRQPTPAAA